MRKLLAPLLLISSVLSSEAVAASPTEDPLVGDERAAVSAEAQEVLMDSKVSMALERIRDYAEREGLTQNANDDHGVLAFGENLDDFAYHLLYYNLTENVLGDGTYHSMDALSILIRQSDLDWDRVFTVPCYDYTDPYDPKYVKDAEMTLRELVKARIKDLDSPWIENINVAPELSTDEWAIKFLAYASLDPRLKRAIRKKMYAKVPSFDEDGELEWKRKRVHVDQYLRGARMEYVQSEVGDESATCHGAHAQEALLTYMVFNDYPEVEIQRVVSDLTDRLDEGIQYSGGNQSLYVYYPEGDYSDIAHRLDGLSQVADQIDLTEDQRKIVQAAADELSEHILELESDSALGGTAWTETTHVYIGLKGLLDAGVIE